MKIIVPEFVADEMRVRACTLLEVCDLVMIDNEGYVAGDVDGVEVVMLPWSLASATVAAVLRPPSLRWVHTVTAGIDHVLTALSPDREVLITNAAGVFDVPIAETVLAYILLFAKRMPELLAQQRERTWRLLRLQEVAGATVGILGMGGIGTEVARRCKALGMRVLAVRRHPEQGSPCVDEMMGHERLTELLAAAHYVVIALPATSETRGLLGPTELAAMRPDGVLINVARGAILDQDALYGVLAAGRIGGAALDVFEEEPLPETSPLWALPNVIITPHNSWSTPYLKTREVDLFLDNLQRYVTGESLLNVVDPAREY
jgi:phosphoglycerate dehydrogenase-like enzyme